MQDTKALYENLQRAAWDAGVTLTDLCIATGVSRATVSRWATGKSDPSVKKYNLLMRKAMEMRDAAS